MTRSYHIETASKSSAGLSGKLNSCHPKCYYFFAKRLIEKSKQRSSRIRNMKGLGVEPITTN